MLARLLPFFVLALLLGLPGPHDVALAQAPSSLRDEASAAVVLSHELVVRDWRRSHERTETWIVRVDDPTRAVSGLPAPASLEGVSDHGATVRGGRLMLPMGTQPGATFTLRKKQRYSGLDEASQEWSTASGLPVLQARAEVRTLSPVRGFAVWADPGASLTPLSGSRPGLEASWQGAPASSAHLVWSAHPDWMSAGRTLQDHVEGLLSAPEEMGRDFGGDLRNMGVANGRERVLRGIDLQGTGAWQTARSAQDIASGHRGTAAERGVLLISMLRAAGFDARPALYRPTGMGVAAPITVPAPAMLPSPAVAVLHPDGEVEWIDPASPYAADGDLPAAMHGALAWIPGDVPVQLAAGGVVDGRVTVSGRLAIDREGACLWSATVTATGVAQEHLREALAPLDTAERTRLFQDMIGASHPTLARFGVTASGVASPRQDLKIVIQAYEPGRFEALGEGMTGQVTPLVAPALSAFLRARVLVHEELSVEGPGHLSPLTAILPPPHHAPQVTLTRLVSRPGQRLVLTTEIERHERAPTETEHSRAREWLEQQSQLGIDLTLQPPASRASSKALLAADRPVAELRVVEALTWWAVTDGRRARKALHKGIEEAGWEAMADQLEAREGNDDPRSWLELHAWTADPAQRLRAAQGLERIGQADLAWRRAARLLESEVPLVRLRALLLVERLQPLERPDAEADPEGHSAWLPPAEILVRARALAEELPPEDGLELWVRLAEQAMDEGRTTEAEVLLERALAARQDGAAMVLLAEAAAASGVGTEEVVQRIDAAVAQAPLDPQVAAVASRATRRAGRADLARRYALSAARLAHDEPEYWAAASVACLEAGDLASSLYAARRASDLAPDSQALAAELGLLATLADDTEAWSTANRRRGHQPSVTDWPPPLSELMGLVPAEGLLALLQFHDDEVVKRPELLAMRAQLRLDAGLLDAAARDGILLDHRHDQPAGVATAFAATVGRTWAPGLVKALDRAAVKDPTARLTRMEYRLLTGQGDALYDARALGEDPRAEALTRMAAHPATVAAEVQGWPESVPRPKATLPRGFRTNRLLGLAPGTWAASSADLGVSVLRAGAITGTIPAPLGLLYTPSDSPLHSLPGGGQLIRLEGGLLPLYAAVAFDGSQEVFGLGFTPDGATRALSVALR